MAGDFIIRNGDGKNARMANFYVASPEGWPLADWGHEADEATGFDTHEEAQDEVNDVSAEGGYENLNVVERETARLELQGAREVQETWELQCAKESRDARQRESETRDNWFTKAGAGMLRAITGRGKAAEIKGGEPALTSEGAAHGFSWDTSENATFDADLWHKGEMMAGVFAPRDGESAWVDVSAKSYGSGDGMMGLAGHYSTLEDGMKAAEEYALHEISARDARALADASKKFHAAPKVPSPEMSPDAAALDLWWDTIGQDIETNPDAGKADLMHADDLLASISLWRSMSARGVEWSAKVETFSLNRGDLQGEYKTIDEAMAATERWAVDQGVKLHGQERQVRALNDPTAFFQKPMVMQLAEASEAFHARAAGELEPSQVKDTTAFLAAHPPAIEEFVEVSESYYAKLAALAESRGGDMDRDAGRDGFDLDR